MFTPGVCECGSRLKVYKTARPRPDRTTRYMRCAACGRRVTTDETATVVAGETVIRRRTRTAAG